MLLKVARQQGIDADDAEDAVQEAMLRAAEHPEIADDRLQAWLVSVTTRLCIDDHRRRVNELNRWRRASGQAVIEQSGQAVEEETCERSEAAWIAALATELLPPRQARALELTAAGCDVQEVATSLGVRYRAAESLLARARRTLRTAISASLGVVCWSWRSQLTGVSGNVVTVGLASAAAAAIVVIIPPVVSSPAPGDPPPTTPGGARQAPTTSGTHDAGATSVYRAPAASASTPSASRPGDGPQAPPPPARKPAPQVLLPLPEVDPPTAQLPQALPRSGPLSPPTLPPLPVVQPPIRQIEPERLPIEPEPPFVPPGMPPGPPFDRIPAPDFPGMPDGVPGPGLRIHP